jgi:glycosyltransferase involved in cell wall biosynthesis
MSSFVDRLQQAGLSVERVFITGQDRPGHTLVRLLPAEQPHGDVLLSYLTDPLVAPDLDWACHSNWWRCRQIAKTFLDLGLAVDVIDWTNREFQPARDYRFLIDIADNVCRLAPVLNQSCVKVLHATGKHWLFHNRAELSRLAAVAERRGIALAPRLSQTPHRGLELCDFCTVLGLGDRGTIETFSYAHKPIRSIAPSSVAEFPWDETKDFERARRRFLWFGSRGMVHKGLDLVLEAFAGMPDLELTVCGLVDEEPDFVECYRRELYQTANIRTLGWVDVRRPEFTAVAHDVAALIFPSASEACAGGVLACMHAGLIPLVSRETGVDVGDGDYVLAESSIPAIREAARQLSRQSGDELQRRSRAVWEFARRNYTRQRYAEEFRRAVVEWLPDAAARLQRPEGAEGSGIEPDGTCTRRLATG